MTPQPQITQKQKNALREIELINREFQEDIADYLKGEYLTTIEYLLDDYLHEIGLVVKKIKDSEEQ